MNPVVLINPFEVPVEEGDEFLARWREAADYLRRQEGFISARMHQSLKPKAKFRFVNVAEWESAEHFQRAVSQPGFRELAGGIPFSNFPALYRVVA
jgi:heme oxygenase (mycobilin-producing)